MRPAIEAGLMSSVETPNARMRQLLGTFSAGAVAYWATVAYHTPLRESGLTGVKDKRLIHLAGDCEKHLVWRPTCSFQSNRGCLHSR